MPARNRPPLLSVARHQTLHGGIEAKYAAIETKSSSLNLATTPAIKGLQGPARFPCCMS